MKLGEMKVDVDVVTGEGKNLFGNLTEKAFNAEGKYSLQGTTQGRYLTGGVPPVRFSM